ncbi:murein L,D-transpeptidase family protein [Rufibacter sp. LB8]|uniref:L,D-transpeptidase family protein n=1 Tax=Rufibacter sp. LB8 TaxID=2777781 RepID=UPI00178C336E|nr:L,D-transpeptidase family protein [Rufibacter sp. LB8]
MKNLLLVLLLFPVLFGQDTFKQEQLRFERVRAAYAQKQATVANLLKKKNLTAKNLNLYLRAFKQERVLEVWAKQKADSAFQLLTTYPFCGNSGTLGPKRQEGDRQIPEGFYYIDRFNPNSNFHLSLGINYPNAADSLRNAGRKLGGDIFLHGDCVTIGCIALTDDKIKEVYVLALEAFNQGQTQIPVHIFPVRFSTSAYGQLKMQYANSQALLRFWENLQLGYQHFEQKKTVPEVLVNRQGFYTFSR